MAGRAGRRGLDKVGTVVIAAWSEIPSEATLKKLLTGIPSRLSSQFRLSYNMILNLLRVNDLSVEVTITYHFFLSLNFLIDAAVAVLKTLCSTNN